MIRFDDYPYSVIREALGKLIGRAFLVALAMLFGGWLAGWSATHSFRASIIGLVEFPDYLFVSVLAGMGFIVLPAILLFAVAFIRWEWPLWSCLVCAVLTWWNIHGTIRWAVYDSPTARMQQGLNDMKQQTTDEMKRSGWKTKDGVSFSKTIGPAHPGPTRSRSH